MVEVRGGSEMGEEGREGEGEEEDEVDEGILGRAGREGSALDVAVTSRPGTATSLMTDSRCCEEEGEGEEEEEEEEGSRVDDKDDE